MFSLKTNMTELEKAFQTSLSSLERGHKWAAQQASQEARQRMEGYLMGFVYNTVPGNRYERTEQALNKLGMQLIPDGDGNFQLILRSDAPYAAQIEQGNQLDYFAQSTSDSHIPVISAEELAQLLDGIGDETGEAHPDAFFARTGQDYQEPGPHVTPAAVDGMYKFLQLLEQVWRNAGATQ